MPMAGWCRQVVGDAGGREDGSRPELQKSGALGSEHIPAWARSDRDKGHRFEVGQTLGPLFPLTSTDIPTPQMSSPEALVSRLFYAFPLGYPTIQLVDGKAASP